MGEARRRKAIGTPAPRPNPAKSLPVQRHVLAMIDRRISYSDGETHFEDHSAKPNTYASADLRTLYRWDGVSIRRLPRQPLDTARQISDTEAAS